MDDRAMANGGPQPVEGFLGRAVPELKRKTP
jgi:hypothetical protein